MSLKDWANSINDNRVGPLLRELAEALENCEDDELIVKATRAVQNMCNSSRTMLYYRNKESARKSLENSGADNVNNNLE